MGLIRTGPRSISPRHTITPIDLQLSYYPHRLKGCFELTRSIISQEPPSVTPHPTVKLNLMQPLLSSSSRSSASRGLQHGNASPECQLPLAATARLEALGLCCRSGCRPPAPPSPDREERAPQGMPGVQPRTAPRACREPGQGRAHQPPLSPRHKEGQGGAAEPGCSPA